MHQKVNIQWFCYNMQFPILSPFFECLLKPCLLTGMQQTYRGTYKLYHAMGNLLGETDTHVNIIQCGKINQYSCEQILVCERGGRGDLSLVSGEAVSRVLLEEMLPEQILRESAYLPTNLPPKPYSTSFSLYFKSGDPAHFLPLM